MIFLKFYLTYPDRAALEAAVDELGVQKWEKSQPWLTTAGQLARAMRAGSTRSYSMRLIKAEGCKQGKHRGGSCEITFPPGHTQEEIGAIVGLTQRRIGQILQEISKSA